MVAEAVHVAHWRREVAALYARVRASCGSDPIEVLDDFRLARDRLFATHPASPLDARARARFQGLGYFRYDPLACVDARLEPLREEAPYTAMLGDDGALGFRAVAAAHFTLRGEPAVLKVYALEGYGGGLWLPFRDASCGSGSYGGGRYLYDTIKGADLGVEGELMPLDFNYAYNPSCAYSARWVCPLAPGDNTLPFAVRAGERTPGD